MAIEDRPAYRRDPGAPDVRPLADAEEPTIGQLVASASRDVSTIVRKEVELAKAEVTGAVAAAGKGAGMFAGAAFFGLFALGFLLTALAWGLVALGLPTWLGFLLVAVLLLVLAAVLALLGKKALAKAKPVPEKAIAEGKQTVEAIKGSL